MFSGIDFSEFDFRSRCFEGGGGFDIFRGKGFTVSAPRGVKFNKNILVSGNNSVEVVLSKNQDTFVFFDFTHCVADKSKGKN